MNALWITKVSAEAKSGDTADKRVEKRDLSSNPTSCPQSLGISAASEFNLSPASVQRKDEQGCVPSASCFCQYLLPPGVLIDQRNCT